MRPNAAMKTVVNEAGIRRRDNYMWRTYGHKPTFVLTEFMVHLEGFGPRRVYLSTLRNIHFIIVNCRRKVLTADQMTEIEGMAA